MRRRPCRHANSLQGLPIAVLSLFNWLQQIARRIGPRMSLDAERAGGAREQTEKSHWEPFQRRTNVAQKPAFANNFRVRCGRVTDPAPSGRRRPGAMQTPPGAGARPPLRSEEQGDWIRGAGNFSRIAGNILRQNREFSRTLRAPPIDRIERGVLSVDATLRSRNRPIGQRAAGLPKRHWPSP